MVTRHSCRTPQLTGFHAECSFLIFDYIELLLYNLRNKSDILFRVSLSAKILRSFLLSNRTNAFL